MSSGRAVTRRLAMTMVLACTATVAVAVATPTSATAGTVPVPIGTADQFAILAGTTITNTGFTEVTGDIGVDPGSAVTGFPPGEVDGAIRADDDVTIQAQADIAAAYDNAVARPTTATVPTELGGETHTTGVYNSASGTFGMAGTLTLDAQGDPNAVFIFKALTTLITAADSTVSLVNGAQACNVFWQVGSSATLGADSTLRGDLLAWTSITVGAGVTVDGRTMAINGAVTLDDDTITRSTCVQPRVLSITAPTAAVDLGNAIPGRTVSRQLGAVTVTDRRGLADAAWTATVASSSFVAAGNPVQTIPKSRVTYWSGPTVAYAGVGTFGAGQATVQDALILSTPRTTFTVVDAVGVTSASWNPTVSVEVPLSASVGAFTGTLTFSVA